MKIINSIFTGLGLGFIVTTLCCLTFVGVNAITLQFLAWLIASALYGLSSLIFDCKRLSLLASTAIHFVFCLCITMTNIFIFYKSDVTLVLILFVLIYVIIYVAIWLAEKRNIRKLNEKLNKN